MGRLEAHTLDTRPKGKYSEWHQRRGQEHHIEQGDKRAFARGRISKPYDEGIRYDIIRSFDRPLLNIESINKVDLNLTTELDWQLFQLQRKYLDYQVNVGNRIIEALQSGNGEAAAKAQTYSAPKRLFQDIIDELFAETGKKIVRSENEIRFSQVGETLFPYQLSSGEKQILAILLTVLVQDGLPYVLFMDEPEVSMHVDWQKKLIALILSLNPNVQIILSTHSPAVIMDGWIDKVTEVSEITIG